MIVKLQGGLGNQMFQYAYGLTESVKRNESLFLDTSLLGIGEPKREYQLGAYGHYVNARFRNDPAAEEGYWQAEKYFNGNLIRGIFARPDGPMPPEVEEIALNIKSNSCFVGVRRGDYLRPDRIGFHGVMPVEYYRESILRMRHKYGDIQIFVFSDDAEWCRENLDFEPIQTQPWWDIWLMSLCEHAIIANSTFHWWGSFLGPDRKQGTIIAPKKWFVNETSEIVPERWITL